MNTARQREVALRILAALPFRTSCRIVALPIMLRRMPDANLPTLLRLVRAEVASQRGFLPVARAAACAGLDSVRRSAA